MAAIGAIGYATVLKVGATPAAVTATVVFAGITSITPPPFARNMVDVTHMSSPDATMEYIAGLNDPGDMSMDINWVAGNATDDEILELTTETEPRLFEILFDQLTPKRTCTFRALLSGYEQGAPLDDKMTAAVTFKVTGKPVWADVV
jgi:hypothetical protein